MLHVVICYYLQESLKGVEIIDTTEQDIIYGRHPVYELLQSNSPIDHLILRLGAGGPIISDIISAAKSRSLRIDRLPPDVFDKKFPRQAGGIAAIISAVQTYHFEDLLEIAGQKSEPPLLVILDGVEDPHNVGAIARTAEAAGCAGLILPHRKAAPLSEAVMKASAGALIHLPVAKVQNISNAVKELKSRGYWIYGADMEGENYRRINFNIPVALIIGSEGQGISRLVKKHCDQLVSIPMKGKVGSLNASVSAGILIYHIITDTVKD